MIGIAMFWLLIVLASGQQQTPATTSSASAHQKANSTTNGTVKDKPEQAPQSTTRSSDNQHDVAGMPQPPSVPPRPRWSEHPWRRLMSLNDTDKLSCALLGVTALYLLATIGIFWQMVRQNNHAEEIYEATTKDTQESLKLTRDGQADTKRAIKIAEDQLQSVLSVVRARVILDIARTENDGNTKSKISSSADRPRLPSMVKVYFLNAGYSPAVNVAVSVGIYFGEDRISDTLGDRSEMSEGDKMNTIGPGKPANATVSLPEQSATKVIQVLAGVETLAVAGEVVYREIFPDTPEHRLKYRAIYEPTLGVWLNVMNQTD